MREGRGMKKSGRQLLSEGIIYFDKRRGGVYNPDTGMPFEVDATVAPEGEIAALRSEVAALRARLSRLEQGPDDPADGCSLTD